MPDLTTISQLIGPTDDELVEVVFTGKLAREFVAMLNMNKVRSGGGRRLVFRWQQQGDKWMLVTESRND